jgi:transmembrane protein DUF3566
VTESGQPDRPPTEPSRDGAGGASVGTPATVAQPASDPAGVTATMPAGPPVRPPDPEGGRPAAAPPPPASMSTSGPAAARPTAAGRPSTPPPSPLATATAAPTGGSARKGGRRARLTVKRIDPWSTLKFAFVYSLAGLVVLLVAVVALYAVVDAMGVIDSIRTFLNDVDQPKSGQGIAVWLTFGRVMTVAIVIGIVNVILFTAFATLTAFVYNVCTELVGGIEVTLAERS